MQWKLQPSTPEQTIAHIRDKPLEFMPGDRMSYRNSGYVLLGMIVERVSGKGYADFLRDNIFKPLGMNETGYDVSATILPQRAAERSRTRARRRGLRFVSEHNGPHTCRLFHLRLSRIFSHRSRFVKQREDIQEP